MFNVNVPRVRSREFFEGKFERERCDMNTTTTTKRREQIYFYTSASTLYSFDDDEGKSDVLDVLIVVVFIVLLISRLYMMSVSSRPRFFQRGRRKESNSV